ncbi:sensor histidine kinase [Legionella micdadei]|uniref:histidine kinase n=2 Tax=Legionella micdadei TaxID=451 RepID=A0A098GEH8_LEGMI|nr:ATP-binding protein [Legionella micdadei]KTD30358.1 sensor histidine kinase [Legionella micdadei]CEG59881.1 putative sensor histidine kinase [Legionella micdadei]SCY52701.1 Signal transduction histidine kinase [Legionella micdadei]
MSKLTSSAKKTYAMLITGNILVLLASIILMQYFIFIALRPAIPPNTVPAIIKLVHRLQSKPESNWPRILQKQKIPWSKMTLSETPLYQDNALLNLQPPIVFDLLKQHKQLQLSVFIKEKAWLNFSLIPPQHNHMSLRIALAVALLGLLFMFFLINYWAVKNLNQPIQTLIQSLKYNESQENWLPIPVTGNSDQRMLFTQINALQMKMSKLLQNRTQVVTAISHDLRTPLTRLKLRMEYLSENEHFEKMMRDINDMEMMIRETLDYFKEAHDEEKKQRFDLVAMLQSLCEDTADLKFDVLFESNANKLIFFGSLNLLKRAFSNLINNAVYYGKHAQVTLDKKANHVEISIEDKGTGLKDNEIERVFLPFYRGETSRSRETGGAGLGLTIAKEIIQLHQGKITLSNRVEGGLKVLVILPLDMIKN